MPVDLETPRPRRRPPLEERHPRPVPQPPPGTAADAPPAALPLTEGVEVTLCLVDRDAASAAVAHVTDHLWALTAETRFEVAAVHPLPGGAKAHFLLKDGGPAGDGAAVIDLLTRIGAHYRWVGVTRVTGGLGSTCRH